MLCNYWALKLSGSLTHSAKVAHLTYCFVASPFETKLAHKLVFILVVCLALLLSRTVVIRARNDSECRWEQLFRQSSPASDNIALKLKGSLKSYFRPKYTTHLTNTVTL